MGNLYLCFTFGKKKLHLITEEIHYPKICYLTPFRPGTLFRYICKQSTTSSEATKCDVWSGSTLFAYRNFYAKYNKSRNISSEPLALKLLIHKLIAGAMANEQALIRLLLGTISVLCLNFFPKIKVIIFSQLSIFQTLIA